MYSSYITVHNVMYIQPRCLLSCYCPAVWHSVVDVYRHIFGFLRSIWRAFVVLFFLPFCCLSFDLRRLITPLVSSNVSCPRENLACTINALFVK